TLVGQNLPSVWNITGLNSGNINGTFFFSSFEFLQGASSTDNFVLTPAGAITGSIGGGAGYDTLDYSFRPGPIAVNLATKIASSVANFIDIQRVIGTAAVDLLTGDNAPSTWHITANNGGDIGGAGVFDFPGFENLVGGSAADTFAFTAGFAISGIVDGGGGNDTFDYSTYPG